jgi:mannose-6-phosphate isomerase
MLCHFSVFSPPSKYTMLPNKRILKLKGKVQHYAWGGYDYIPALLSIPNVGHKPFAEYWMGAHPGAPSEVLGHGENISLTELIASDPSAYLGETVYNEFGELPYLLKILDVRDMLSIQVHPAKEEAQKGFNTEEASKIPVNAPNRNYKDRNHKPEVMVALSEFWLLHGFKSQHTLHEVLTSISEFNFLVPVFAGRNYFELYKKVMELPQIEVDQILLPLVKKEAEHRTALSPSQPGYWVNKLFDNGQPFENLDRGIFSIYFFNIVQLQPGEAIFQGAGIPHAYLHGQNVELMANSDNVLRGGLTPKHIDVPELLKHTLFKGVEPDILKGAPDNGKVNYRCPVKDFGISAIYLNKGDTYSSVAKSAEICILIEGSATWLEGSDDFKKGESFLILPGTSYTLEGSTKALIYKAFVP